MNRRSFLAAGGSALALASQTGVAFASANRRQFEVTRTTREWRAMLTPLEYKVMRKGGTERAGTSPLDKLWDNGTYHCRGCDQPLYSSKTKYDSGTGWPSFWAALPDAVATKPDYTLFGIHTEVHCDRCGSHLGHIFDDGPPPTGKRHCLNGVSLVFRAA